MDANDVEFVLALPRESHVIQSEGHSTYPITIKSQILREHIVWILDFDCCKHMPLDGIGAEPA